MASLASKEEFEYICKLIFESIQIPVIYVKPNYEIDIHLSSAFQTSPLFSDYQELMRALIGDAHHHHVPIIRSTNHLENFVMLSVNRKGQFLGTLIVGPSVYSSHSDETITSLMHDNHVPNKHRHQWSEYLRHLPVISKMRLFHISLLAHFLVYKESLEITDVLENNHDFEQRFIPVDNVDLNLSTRRENSLFHMNPVIESSFLQHIKNGDKNGLLEALNAIPQGEIGVLSKRSRLRSQKNLSYCGITLATRAAVEGGLHVETAYTLSDFHIQHIEELKEVKHVENAYVDACLDFAERVRKNKLQNVSKPIASCQNYIFNHIYEEITLSSLSDLTGLNANYLSQLFKKETGITLSHYMQRERIEESKKLLVLTDNPIANICSRLNFYDQTYFNKIFKKHTGITPKQYRNNRSVDSFSH